ncbi:mitochondrial ribosomal protein L29 [Scenedesmus sp. NREL 46B-D3]|nr:mitochondrial ribosomal protein L29 [Scenedesmus sp. NREL 46B-D3]
MLATRVKVFQAAGSRPQVRGASVIVAARPTKAADFKGLDNTELLQKVGELKREHLRLEYMQRTRGNVINPGAEANPDAVAPKASEFKQVRRSIAQLLTLLREREIEAGIGRKKSRQLRKEAKVAAGFGRF